MSYNRSNFSALHERREESGEVLRCYVQDYTCVRKRRIFGSETVSLMEILVTRKLLAMWRDVAL